MASVAPEPWGMSKYGLFQNFTALKLSISFFKMKCFLSASIRIFFRKVSEPVDRGPIHHSFFIFF